MVCLMRKSRVVSPVRRILLALSVLMLSVVSVRAATRTVRVGYFKSDGVNQKAEDGTLSGYGYDFFMRLAKYADWKLEFVGYERDWSDMLPMLERGEIDILGFVTETPERHDRFAFSGRPMAYTCTSIRTTPGRLGKYRLPATGMWPRSRVGYMEGDLSSARFENFAIDHSFAYELKGYPNESEAIEACKRGELELVALDAFAPYCGLASVGEIQYVRNHLAVRKGDTALLAEVDKAMDALYRSEPGWMAEVRGGYYPLKSVTAYLPAYLDGPMRRYQERLLMRLSDIGGWKITIKTCAADFHDADLSGDTLGCGVFFTMPEHDRFEMPRHCAGRRRADFFARPDDMRFTNGIPVVSSPYRVGYVRDEKMLPKFLRDYATEKGVSYRLFPVGTRTELEDRLGKGEFDLIIRSATPETALKRVAACDYVAFYVAPPAGNSSLAHAISEMLMFMHLDDPEYFLRLESECFATGDDDGRHVRVAAYGERGLAERDENGNLVGMVPDILHRVALHAGWNMTYLLMTYPEAQRALAEGTVDVIGYMTRTPEREKLYDFSGFTLGPLVYSLMTPADSHLKVNDSDSWACARIGVMRGSKSSQSLAKLLADRGVRWFPRYYNDILDSEAALRRGELDAALTLANSGNRDLVSLAEIPTDLCYFSTSRRKPWVRRDFDAAFGEILRDDPGWIGDLASRHLRTDRNVLLFSTAELAYIRSMRGRPITVSFDVVQPPLVAVDSARGEVTGVYRRLFDRFSSVSGMNFVLLPPGTPSDIKVCIDGMDDDPDPAGIMDDCWLKSGTCWVKHRSSQEKERNGMVAVLEGDRRSAEFIRQSGLRPLSCRDREGAYEAVCDGRADSYVANYAVARYYIDELKRYPALSVQRIAADTFFRPVSVLTSSAADSRLRSILAKLRDTMSDGDLDTLIFESIYSIRPSTVRTGTLVLSLLGVLVVAGLIIFWIAWLARLFRSMSQAKTRFLNSMSHDIRTPMNAIIGFSTIARRNLGDPAKVEECLGKIDVAGTHLLQLINEVLDMSRIESGTIELHEEPFDIVHQLDTVRVLFGMQSSRKGLDFSVDSSGIRHRWVRCDPTRLGQIVLNVVGNAVKYTKAGSVKVVCRETESSANGGVYVLTVSDTGIGMSKEFLRRIYDPFAREQTSTISGIQGSGLGMSIVRKMIDVCHGDIDITSEVGRGTTVTLRFSLPYCEEPASEEKAEAPKPVNLAGRRVLLVEDNALNREVARFVLESMGIVVDECVNGKEAVEKLRETGSDVYSWVLMDIQMPVMNGYEAARAIRQFNTAIPIIAMTADAFAEDREAALKAGMNEHITKPVQGEIIKAALVKLSN